MVGLMACFADVALAQGLPVKMYYSISEASQVTGVSRDALYRAARAGELRTSGRGRKTVAKPEWIDEWTERRD